MKTNQKGSVEVWVTIAVIAVTMLLFHIKWQTSEDLVSGIVYNNTNDEFISGNTTFSVRASEDSYVNEKNTSTYCLPPNSPYIPLVKEAAADKSIKVIVIAYKDFQIMPMWGCMDNIKVERAK